MLETAPPEPASQFPISAKKLQLQPACFQSQLRNWDFLLHRLVLPACALRQCFLVLRVTVVKAFIGLLMVFKNTGCVLVALSIARVPSHLEVDAARREVFHTHVLDGGVLLVRGFQVDGAVRTEFPGVSCAKIDWRLQR